jgi:hypothetical protein
VLAGCARSDHGASPPDRPGVESVLDAAEAVTPSRSLSPSCRPELVLDGLDAIAALELAVTELARAQADSEPTVGSECEASRHPLCAAIFLIGATDPVLGIVREADRPELDRLVDLHERVLELAVALAERADRIALAGSFRRLGELDTSVVSAGDDAVVALLIARSAPEIVAPIAVAERGC